MNSLANKSFSTSLNRDLKNATLKKRILFAAPSTSGQLQIAKYFWEFYGSPEYEASFASLENNIINPWLSTAMRNFGFELRRNQIESVFTLSTTSNEFGCIVSLGGFQNYGNISPFMETLNILFGKSPTRIFWKIPDPENGTGTQDELIRYAEDIRNRIEFEVAQLAQSLEETE